MKILLVEDDANKRAAIRALVSATLPGSQIEEVASYQSGLRTALESRHDYVLLDMTMPNYDARTSIEGGRQRAFAGRDIMRELKRKHVRVRVVVVTQFESFGHGVRAKGLDELEADLTAHFPGLFVSAVYYSAARQDWKEKLANILRAGVAQ